MLTWINVNKVTSTPFRNSVKNSDKCGYSSVTVETRPPLHRTGPAEGAQRDASRAIQAATGTKGCEHPKPQSMSAENPMPLLARRPLSAREAHTAVIYMRRRSISTYDGDVCCKRRYFSGQNNGIFGLLELKIILETEITIVRICDCLQVESSVSGRVHFSEI
jgi:hypothetical protein